MRVACANEIDMDRQAPVHPCRPPELFDQTRCEIRADDRLRHEGGVFQVGSTGEIDDESGKRLVERGIGIAVTCDTCPITDGGLQCLAEGNANILDRMMRIHHRVARAYAAQIEATVPA